MYAAKGRIMTVQELIEELSKIENRNLDVVILSNDIDFKTVTELSKTELGYKESNFEVKNCIRLQ